MNPIRRITSTFNLRIRRIGETIPFVTKEGTEAEIETISTTSSLLQSTKGWRQEKCLITISIRVLHQHLHPANS